MGMFETRVTWVQAVAGKQFHANSVVFSKNRPLLHMNLGQNWHITPKRRQFLGVFGRFVLILNVMNHGILGGMGHPSTDH